MWQVYFTSNRVFAFFLPSIMTTLEQKRNLENPFDLRGSVAMNRHISIENLWGE